MSQSTTTIRRVVTVSVVSAGLSLGALVGAIALA